MQLAPAGVAIISKTWLGRGGSSAIFSSGWVLDKINVGEMVAATHGLADLGLCNAISETMDSNGAAFHATATRT